MKTVYDRMMENDSYQKTKDFIIKQKWPYPQKKAYAEKIAWEFYQHPDVAGRCYVTVGGLDSITLFLFLRSIGINVPAVSVSSLEDKSIQLVHKALGIRSLPPIKDENGRPYTKMRVIQQYGYPVISKEAAQKISHLQNPTSKNATVRHAIMTGETGEYGGFKKNSRMKMSQKWLEKFGGPENENEGTNYQTAPFKVSDACCYYLKERPCDLYAKETKCFPYLGLMASEGGRRQKSLMWNGCNYVGKKTKRSCPFAIFSRQDLLTLALEMDAYYHAHWKEFKPITVDADTGAVTYEEPIHLGTIVPAIYGEIAECGHRSEAEIQELVEANGGIMDESFSKPLLCTTLAQRTGCSMCGFGVHMEKRPHRFDLLWERNPKDGAISSFVDGGGQEMGRRSGTENVPGIIGTAVALMLADGLMLHNAQKVRHLRDRIIDELSSMDGVLVTGPDPGPMRLPGLASFIIDGVDSETLVMDLSAKGVCVSAGSACSSGTGKPSYVLRAMGYSEREAWSSLRVSLDDHITHDEVSELIHAIKSSIKVIRNQH